MYFTRLSSGPITNRVYYICICCINLSNNMDSLDTGLGCSHSLHCRTTWQAFIVFWGDIKLIEKYLALNLIIKPLNKISFIRYKKWSTHLDKVARLFLKKASIPPQSIVRRGIFNFFAAIRISVTSLGSFIISHCIQRFFHCHLSQFHTSITYSHCYRFHVCTCTRRIMYHFYAVILTVLCVIIDIKFLHMHVYSVLQKTDLQFPSQIHVYKLSSYYREYSVHPRYFLYNDVIMDCTLVLCFCQKRVHNNGQALCL